MQHVINTRLHRIEFSPRCAVNKLIPVCSFNIPPCHLQHTDAAASPLNCNIRFLLFPFAVRCLSFFEGIET